MNYIIYRDVYGVPRVTTKEFADQINKDSVIDHAYTIDGAVLAVVRWYEDVARGYLHMKTKDFAAFMGLSDVNE